MGINFKGVIKGTFFALVVTFVIIFILSVLSYFTGIGENVISICVYASVVIGVLLGTIAVSKAASQKAFIHSMLVCILYMLILAGVSFLINKEISLNTHFLAITGGAFAAAFLGLIIGK